MNFADLVSQGQPKETCLQARLTYNEEEINSERRKNVVSALLNSNNLTLDWYYRRFSQYEKIQELQKPSKEKTVCKSCEVKKCDGGTNSTIQRVYPLELELKSEGVHKAVGERFRESVEEDVIRFMWQLTC
ncbi:hypothetical protein ILUMI_21828 [Ignelater luminosus]|uniref:Uncharacterized protein n=1 Tax=Ignelater luminosus TaxID=2038154 RepID=A0A8K0G3H1_IGNLU|nr:hypothetical protein ILUMI_21828 [Ignelater luminosus]